MRLIGRSVVAATFCMLGYVALGAGTTGCPAAAAPISSCVASVLADALQGLTIQQILDRAGPGCVADAAQVATILLGSEDPNVQATPAFKAARASRSASMIFPPASAFAPASAVAAAPPAPSSLAPSTQR